MTALLLTHVTVQMAIQETTVPTVSTSFWERDSLRISATLEICRRHIIVYYGHFSEMIGSCNLKKHGLILTLPFQILHYIRLLVIE